MKKIAFAAVAVLIATPAFAAPGDTDTATGTATATVVAPVTLTSDTNLSFGTIVADKDNNGTVQLAASSAAATYSNVSNVGTVAPARASFTVGGTSGTAVTITGVADDLENADGDTMGLVLDLAAAPTSISATAADNTFFVGGTLSVAADQAAGSYSGDYTLTADYN